MKHIKITNIFSLLLILATFSCSDDPKPKPEPSITSIILSSDNQEIALDEKAELKVVANTKEDLTDASKFFINSTEIGSSTFSPTQVGSYEITAKYENIISNKLTIKVNEAPARAITISVDREQVPTGQTVTFSVITDKDEDVSSEAQIYVNGTLIDGNTFTPDSPGDYKFYAKYGEALQSEEIKLTVLGDIKVYVDKEQVITGEAITITVKKENGEDISGDATLYVNENKINGLSFTPNTVGNYTVYAVYEEDIKSENIDFFAVNEQTSFQKHPVVEAFVHMKCPYCPRIHYAIELLQKQTNNVIPILLHPATRSTWVDDMYHEDAKYLFFDIYENLKTVPNGIIDRMKTSHPETGEEVWKQWTFDHDEHKQLNVVLDLVDNTVYTGFALELSKVENQLHIKTKVNFLKDFDQQLNLILYILENNLVYDQSNKPEKGFYEGVNPIKDFVNNNVYKGSFNGTFGESIALEATIKNNIYSKELTTDIPESINNSDEITVVAIVTNAETKEIINARSITLGDERQKFEFK